MDKEKREKDPAIEKVLRENEIKANQFVSKAYLVAGAWLLFLFVIFIAGLVQKTYLQAMAIACGVIAGVLFALFFLGLIVKWDRPWLKYLYLYLPLCAFGTLSLFYGAVCTVFVLLPVVLSCRYYLEKISLTVAVVTIALTVITSLVSERLHLFVDFNTVMVENFDFNPNTTPLSEILSHVNEGMTVRNYLITTTLPVTVLTAIISTVCYVVSKNARLNLIKQTEETEKHARIETELTLATDIQANMLPRVFPAFPDRSEFDIFASMNPAKEVGGDFYDMFLIDKDHLAVAIADVSGKGVPAALFMVVAKTLLNDQALLLPSVETVCNVINKRLCKNNDAGLFVTAWFGVLDLKTGKMQYVNAGHNPPLMLRGGKAEFLKNRSGFFFAGRESTVYKPFELEFGRGDKLFLYTDGVTEARNAKNEMFGNDLLQATVESGASLSVTDLAGRVKDTLDEFTKGEEQFDDVTMLCLEFKGENEKFIPEEKL